MLKLSRVIDAVEALRPPSIAVRARHCTRRHHRASTCSRCEQVCPAQALTLSADGPQVDALGCADCGACASVCPTGAIVSLKPRDPALTEGIAEAAAPGGRVVIACTRAPSPGPGSLTLPCLARLDPSLLVFAFAKGAGSVSLSTGACDECPLGDAAPHVTSVAAAAQRLLEAFEVPGHIGLGEELEPPALAARAEPEARSAPERPSDLEARPESEARSGPGGAQPAGLTRRGFFNLLRKGGTVCAAQVGGLIPTPEAAPDEPRQRIEDPGPVPVKRERLLEALRALAPEGSAPREASGPLVAPQLDRARCDGCALCGRICPTGALGVEEEADGTLRIICRESACVACGLCVEVCRRQALSLAPAPTALVLSSDAPRTTLFERAQGEAEPLHASIEDKMSKLLGAAVYRT